MVEIAVKYIESVTGARGVAGNGERLCRGVFIDSRLVEHDGIFVAFAGERVDGNDYAERALEAGAGAVVLTREPTEDERAVATRHGAAIFVTDDPEEFLLRLAQGYRARQGGGPRPQAEISSAHACTPITTSTRLPACARRSSR